MNSFLSEPVSAEAVFQAGLPFLEVVGGLLAIVALFLCVIALLHIIVAIRSADAHIELHQMGDAKARIDLIPLMPEPRRKLLHVPHFRGWLFTR
jgi:hypothetical protein